MKKNLILIVEDERMTFELLKWSLEKDGFGIIHSSDGEDGLKKAREYSPSLIILDIMLPNINGLQVCKILKTCDLTRNIPVIMLTSKADLNVKLESFECGADDYIIKPFEQRELLARIKCILRLINLQKSLDDVREEVDRLSVINEINKAISSSLDIEEIFKIIGRQIKRLITYDLIHIALLDKNDKFMKVRTLIPEENIEIDQEVSFPAEDFNVSKLQHDHNFLSEIKIPLISRGKNIGIFGIGAYKSNAFSDTDIEVAHQIAPQVAIAIENARLYEKVKDSEKKYEELFDNALDLILLNDPNTGSIVGANRIVSETLHFSEQELARMKLGDIISEESCLSASEILEMINGEGELIFETIYKSKKDILLPVEVSAKVIDFNGRPIIQSFARDITFRKHSEKELRFLANITTNAPLAIIGTDVNGIITSWNKGSEIIFGYRSEEILGKSHYMLFPDELLPDKEHFLEEAFAKDILEEVETERISKFGKRIPVKITYSVVRDDGGSITGLAHIIRNIAPEIELQKQLVQSEKLSTMGQLVSGVAHELNNPLTGIIGFSELLMLEAPKTFQSDLKRIHKEAVRSKRIVQNLLSFARMHKPEKSKADINAIINNVMELKMYEMRVDNIDVKCELASDLPLTMGDAHQLQQVFLNIINNAHQAITCDCNGGSLSVKTCCKGTTIFIEFKDSGPGILKENLTKIFDPFFTTKDVGKGTGLGLSLSYGIIKDHGGYIQVWSEEGKGATFTIELPVISSDNLKSNTKAISSYIPVKGYDILVVDDEETVLELLKGILVREGNRVELARDGFIALEKIAHKGYFHVIICDIKMPNMNGSELYQILSEQKSEMVGNFIFMSGATVSLEHLNFFDHSVHPFLEKPFPVSEVLHAISRIVNKNILPEMCSYEVITSGL